MANFRRGVIDAQGDFKPMKGTLIVLPRRKSAPRVRRSMRCKVLVFCPVKSSARLGAVIVPPQSVLCDWSLSNS
jgi:hypothetical protein